MSVVETGATSEPAAAQHDRTRERTSFALILLMAPLCLLVFMGLPLLIRAGFVEAFQSEGPSMLPTLRDGDRYIVDKSAYGLFLPFTDEQLLSWDSPAAGDIVIIKSPADGVDIVKRVVGVAGDRIEWHGDRLWRNGNAVPRERADCPEVMHSFGNPECAFEQLGARRYRVAAGRHGMPEPLPVAVPRRHVYVLGDFRTSSNDSRNPAIGAVDTRLIKGRVTRIYYSSEGGDRVLTMPE